MGGSFDFLGFGLEADWSLSTSWKVWPLMVITFGLKDVCLLHNDDMYGISSIFLGSR